MICHLFEYAVSYSSVVERKIVKVTLAIRQDGLFNFPLFHSQMLCIVIFTVFDFTGAIKLIFERTLPKKFAFTYHEMFGKKSMKNVKEKMYKSY